MTHRFYIPKIQFIENRFIISEASMVKQLIYVLRVQLHDRLVLFDELGREFEMNIIKIKPDLIETELKQIHESNREPDIEIILYQSLLKKDRWEWLLQKSAELGVSEIQPMITEYSVVDKLSDNKRTRYEKILIEATEQSGGTRIPRLGEIKSFQQILEECRLPDYKTILLHPERNIPPLYNVIQDAKKIRILIGPEGGFSPVEIKQAISAGITIAGLGKRILRSETAGIIALGIIYHIRI